MLIENHEDFYSGEHLYTTGTDNDKWLRPYLDLAGLGSMRREQNR
jgi:hypothetical protein